MYRFVRPILFRLEPESAHNLTIDVMRLLGSLRPVRSFLRSWWMPLPQPVSAFGLQFANPVGLAAGYDKDGLGWRGLACLGFGHIEIGTVTLKGQPGNSRPRVFRLPEAGAIINRMGFPGRGADFVLRRLQGDRPSGLVLGVNLGKNKDTPLEDATGEYVQLMKLFAPHADYLAVNVSSPNTIGLRRLQARSALEDLLGELANQRVHLVKHIGRYTPILVKLAPDLTGTELLDALDVLVKTGMDGVIATNTTVDRSDLAATRLGQGAAPDETGGLSGAPLRARSTAVISQIVRITHGRLPVIGVGGIMTPDDAREKLDAGACLVQVYTGLIYRGPRLVQETVRALAQEP